jgi:hypothetical protein
MAEMSSAEQERATLESSMTVSFADCNDVFINALISQRSFIETQRVLPKQFARLISEGGHLLKLLPINFVFDTRDCATLAEAALALIRIQTKVIRHLIEQYGRSAFLDMFDVPEIMRRFVNWEELQNPKYLVGRIDILAARDRYYFCELNVDSCVAGAEIFDYCDDYFREIGLDIRREIGVLPPLAELGALLARRATALNATRIVILDWSAGGGSPGKGYLSFDRMKDYLAAEVGSIPIYLRNERTFDRAWLLPQEAARTVVHRGFMMSEMDDNGIFLDELISSGAHVLGTYEADIRMDKSWFALLHDSDIQATLNANERELIFQYVPYTRSVKSDTLAEVIAQKERYIFKEKNSFGGGGICIGAESSALELWSVLGKNSCNAWIAQELLTLPQACFPKDETFICSPHHMVFGLYIYGDRTNGMLVRASTKSKIVNVTIGNAKLGWAVCADEAQRIRMTSHLIDERV